MCEAGQKHGWKANIHVEEIEYIGGAEMGVDIGARALSHLEKVSDNAIRYFFWHLEERNRSSFWNGTKYKLFSRRCANKL